MVDLIVDNLILMKLWIKIKELQVDPVRDADLIWGKSIISKKLEKIYEE